ncbi:prenyltransferase/squalene oxidase repeat-containing protein [Rubinisphaera brasiliensis]|uniref:Squalene cyclase C-terminal domain-containing protein n=1 Tax=Rubinisphaera brasiliensis (strain ATCC 49424 / DSM 5305 / JCM 21570 / IAM 15109 / NBRC 103401 / IFAM 1448) TaxID=756272 RepID=F0SFI5_RUBBR|nr:prenyltransferase/squalene oxidase repeat-containing protein [Rubinisphaera brasiliensis]ADY60445.1 hypothetical protein Plabr_2846 [Rubinisphaera brasiliensis DSM 5305]
MLHADSDHASASLEQTPPDESRLQWDRGALLGLFSSLFLHLLILVVLGLIVIRFPGNPEVLRLIVESPVNSQPTEELTEISVPNPELDSTLGMQDPSSLMTPQPETALSDFKPRLFAAGDVSAAQLASVRKIDVSSHFGGRSPEAREDLLRLFGGTVESERAVRLGLRWLAQRQKADGSWNFDHRRPGDRHGDHQAGSLRNCPIAATSLALMAFMGAGHTQDVGDYTEAVEKGVDFLLNAAQKTPEGADLRGRNGDKVPTGNYAMYAHALATIAMCENFAMTKDRRVRLIAQEALGFIVQTRNREEGGWRYEPEEAGDLSVTGWMIMALQSGRTSGLQITNVAFKSSELFLDSVQKERGSRYAYIAGRGPSLSTTAIGLLCRMYLGWEQARPALDNGVQYLADVGPDPANIYHNYYATQVLHHSGGKRWTNWNEVMRDQLVNSQLKGGPEKGSWNVTDPHGRQGGRLYQTCLSIMTLEVYYRHLPLYQSRALVAE